MSQVPRLSLAALFLTLPVAAQTFGSTFGPLPIPDGPGACGLLGAPRVITVNVPFGTPAVGTLALTLDVAHTWYSDLDLVVQAPGGFAALVLGTASGCGSSSDLGGQGYVLLDGAPQTLDFVAGSLPGGQTIPAGAYRADLPLAVFAGQGSAGTWTFSFRDRALGDSGSVSGVFLHINTCPYTTYSLTQNGAGQPLTITHLCARPGDLYLAPAVLGPAGSNPGGVPNGWFLGLDIPLQGLFSQLAFGPPFYGAIPGSGLVSFSFSVPAGFTISTCAVHVDPLTGFASYIGAAFNYTTI